MKIEVEEDEFWGQDFKLIEKKIEGEASREKRKELEGEIRVRRKAGGEVGGLVCQKSIRLRKMENKKLLSLVKLKNKNACKEKIEGFEVKE